LELPFYPNSKAGDRKWVKSGASWASSQFEGQGLNKFVNFDTKINFSFCGNYQQFL